MVNRANKLFTAVRLMFKATSPLNRLLSKAADEPPGADAIIINPTPNSGLRFNSRAMKNAQKGRKNIWHINAIIIALGFFNTRVKSLIDKDIPNPSIKIQRRVGSTTVAKGVCIDYSPFNITLKAIISNGNNKLLTASFRVSGNQISRQL